MTPGFHTLCALSTGEIIAEAGKGGQLARAVLDIMGMRASKAFAPRQLSIPALATEAWSESTIAVCAALEAYKLTDDYNASASLAAAHRAEASAMRLLDAVRLEFARAVPSARRAARAASISRAFAVGLALLALEQEG